MTSSPASASNKRMPHTRIGQKNFASFLRRQPRWSLFTSCILLVLFIGYIDFVTGYEISLFIFYALPILLAVWFLSTSTFNSLSDVADATFWSPFK